MPGGKPSFNLKSKKEPESLIIMVFKYKGRRVVLSTGIKVPVKFWNSAQSRVRETQDLPLANQYNQRLAFIESKNKDLWFEYQNKGIIPAPTEFKKKLNDRINFIEEIPVKPQLLTYINSAIKKLETEGVPKGSIQVYKSMVKQVIDYQKARRKILFFEDLTARFLVDFKKYLSSAQLKGREELGYSQSYIHKNLTTLKKFVKMAKDENVCENCPFLDISLNVSKQSRDTIYLTEKEIEHLFSLEVNGRLYKVRDMFLIGCLTGLRFSDYSIIRPSNFQNIEDENGNIIKCLIVRTKKTKTEVIIPVVNPMLVDILDRHGWKAPEKISNQKINSYLKTLGRIAGFNEEIEIQEYRGISDTSTSYTAQKWELICSHTARRSFATNAYFAGIPISDIMKFTGHSTEKVFKAYIKADKLDKITNAIKNAKLLALGGKRRSPLKVVR